MGTGKTETPEKVIKALTEAACMYARCVEEGCIEGLECHSLQALKLASLIYVWHILELIAAKRMEKEPEHAYQASGEAVAAVANELSVVVAELNTEFKLRRAVANGEAGEC